MKNKIFVIGIILVFLMVGFSGCQEVGLGITNIGDITANPEDYYGKEVTIEGTCASALGYGVIQDNDGHSMSFIYDNALTGRYRLTGTIVEDNTNKYFQTTYYLEVDTVKAL